MCTLTFIPLPHTGKNRQFVVTANRDESPNRAADKYVKAYIGNDKTWYPAEPVAGGSNFVVQENGKILTLLNGAFKRHEHKPPYRKSRGLVVLEYLEFQNMAHFVVNYNLNGIEPFTLVSFEEEISELRWDGKNKHVQNHSYAEPKIWSSAQLYEEQVIKNREQWFQDFISMSDNLKTESILNFHFTAGKGDPANDLLMNRNNMVRTISISQVVADDDQSQNIEISHFDLLSNKKIEVDFNQE